MPKVIILSGADHRERFRNQPLTENAMRLMKNTDTGLKECILYAKGLSVCWGDNNNYWRWFHLEDDKEVEAAELIKVNWLEVRGKTKLNLLQSNVKYWVLFSVWIKDACNIDTEVTFTLETPNAENQVTKVDLNLIKRNAWVQIKIGEFDVFPNLQNKDEEVKFSFTDFSQPLKKGIVIEGVHFWPQRSAIQRKE